MILFYSLHDVHMSLFDTCRPGTGPRRSRLSSPSSTTRLVARTALPMFLEAVTCDDAGAVGVGLTQLTLLNMEVLAVTDPVLESAAAAGA